MPYLIDGGTPFVPAVPERLDGDIDADLVTEFETVGDRSPWRFCKVLVLELHRAAPVDLCRGLRGEAPWEWLGQS